MLYIVEAFSCETITFTSGKTEVHPRSILLVPRIYLHKQFFRKFGDAK
jgi:hypothetical protein